MKITLHSRRVNVDVSKSVFSPFIALAVSSRLALQTRFMGKKPTSTPSCEIFLFLTEVRVTRNENSRFFYKGCFKKTGDLDRKTFITSHGSNLTAMGGPVR